jgi:cell division initiation protein
MPIRPIDVRRKEFGNSFRGYDANQVDEFLDAVADEFERAYMDNSRMREEISSLRERLQQFEELEGSIRTALVHAEQAAHDLRRSATQEAESLRQSAGREAEDLRRTAGREADLTIREAKARSHQMLAESAARLEHIQESYEALQEAKRNFANDFRHLLKTYMDVMENMELASAREIEASLRERLDTESIAVAREAATYDDEGAEPAQPEVAEDTVFGEQERAEDTVATERIEPAETASEAPQTVPEVEEPAQAEPFSSRQDPALVEESAAVEESAEAEDVERDETALVEDSSSQTFFDEEDGEASSEERRRESRIFRASRFLRRRE